MISKRAAARRGWEGPYRYRLPKEDAHARVIHGWIVKRGQKWLYFWSASDDRQLKLPLSEERHMISLKEAARANAAAVKARANSELAR